MCLDCPLRRSQFRRDLLVESSAHDKLEYLPFTRSQCRQQRLHLLQPASRVKHNCVAGHCLFNGAEQLLRCNRLGEEVIATRFYGPHGGGNIFVASEETIGSAKLSAFNCCCSSGPRFLAGRFNSPKSATGKINRLMADTAITANRSRRSSGSGRRHLPGRAPAPRSCGERQVCAELHLCRASSCAARCRGDHTGPYGQRRRQHAAGSKYRLNLGTGRTRRRFHIQCRS